MTMDFGKYMDRIKQLQADSSNIQFRTNDYKKLYNSSEFPLFYPNTWLPLCESSEVESMQIKPIFAFGRDLIIYRGMSGQCYIMDAYCPHMGANLSVAGSVYEESIKCQFCEWIWNSEGMCEYIQGIQCDNLPNIRITIWRHIEINNYIYVWHHSKGYEPHWYPTENEELKQNKLINHAKVVHEVHSHSQELAENAADVAHLSTIHKDLIFGKRLELPTYLDSLREYQSFNWFISKEYKHISISEFKTIFKLFGKTMIQADNSIKFIGPTICNYRLEIEGFLGHHLAYLLIDISQFGPLRQKNVTRCHSKSGFISTLICKYLATEIYIQGARDTLIWNNKKYLKKAYYAKNEPALVEFKRWTLQFS